MDKNPSKYLGRELEYVKKVLEGENWSATTGNWNQTLERTFADRIGTKYGIAMNSGTATLHSALLAAGVKAGDEVLSPGLTVIMDTTATIHANAVPVYVDVDPMTFNMDPKDLRKKITSKSKAIIVVSLYGLPADMDEIMEISKEFGLVVIEDNAQCVLSKYRGRMLGTIGHMSSYSFENTKHLSCGEGGMVLTDNEEYAISVRKIGGHGFKNLKAEEGRVRLNQDVFQNPGYKRHDELGWNYRLSEFGAAVVMAQLERVDHLVELRVKSAEVFMESFGETGILVPQHTPEDRTHSYYTLGAKYYGDDLYGVSWEEFRRMYVEEGGDGIYGAWSVPYLEPVIQYGVFGRRNPEVYGHISYEKGICPVAEEVQPRIMQFKTNYRDLNLATQKAGILKRIIKKITGQ